MKDNMNLLRLEEVALLVGVSFKTINTWYAFKREHPENEYAKILPEYIQVGKRGTRYWKKAEIWKFIQFKQSIPQGRAGIMGCVTQKYYNKERNADGSINRPEQTDPAVLSE